MKNVARSCRRIGQVNSSRRLKTLTCFYNILVCCRQAEIFYGHYFYFAYWDYTSKISLLMDSRIMEYINWRLQFLFALHFGHFYPTSLILYLYQVLNTQVIKKDSYELWSSKIMMCKITLLQNKMETMFTLFWVAYAYLKSSRTFY